MNLIFTHHPADALDTLLHGFGNPLAIILADSNTKGLCAEPLRTACPALVDAPIITVEAGDDHKGLPALAHVWEQMQLLGATRKSILINVGGGMVTDMGGFAAATFKRGVRFINVPTSLLAAVDAAVGGKTGVNFGGLKNEIGVFRDADAVVISPSWFATLPERELRSGYAEMLKHGLIDSMEETRRLLDFDIAAADLTGLLPLIEKSVGVKARVVEADPTEKGLRKALNLGHTAGHALESLAMKRDRPVPHGYAVAWGLVTDLILSHMKLGMPTPLLHEIAAYVGHVYGAPLISCDDYPDLIELMAHDKKNAVEGEVNFTLLDAPGKIHLDCIVGADDIKAALDILRDLMHL
ncbi:MAG: 3-dehydroquinate synthase [Pseudoflavonifractor sp.]|nr:3-dehydroquinate synthase [Alloprevotella sp.]MCM1115967.1 3-dehydroquinate synthase [Pseudoflavonifractor sp.]